MTASERRQAILGYKAERGCERCGKRLRGRDLQLVRSDGSGLHFSRYLSTRALTDQELWEEVRRRQVVCRRCVHRRDRSI